MHIPHNAIHKELLSHGLANLNRNKSKRKKSWIRFERKHSLSMVYLDSHTSNNDEKKRTSTWSWMTVCGAFSRAGNSMPKKQIIACSSSKRLWANLAG
jgi:hypothetical protein